MTTKLLCLAFCISTVLMAHAAPFLSEAVQQCTSSERGTCDCDCSWTNRGANCGTDDGSCCFGCCCGEPTPLPTPTNQSSALYCPNPAVDFMSEWDANVQLTSSGWHITGNARVSSKAAFNLLGGYLEFDMDNTAAAGGDNNGVNHNVYLASLQQPNCGLSCYCDWGGGKGGCMELDIIEANGNCSFATTWHTQQVGGTCDNCAASGTMGNHIHVRAEFSETGVATVTVNGVSMTDQMGPAPNEQDATTVVQQMQTHGVVVESSQWHGWVPGSCRGGDLASSSFAVSNLKVMGTIVNGPMPPTCAPSLPPSPAQPAPPPAPSSAACPGSSLTACMGLCPATPVSAYKACVQECASRCA